MINELSLQCFKDSIMIDELPLQYFKDSKSIDNLSLQIREDNSQECLHLPINSEDRLQTQKNGL